MSVLILFGFVLLTAAVFAGWARGIVQSRPHSAAGVVLSSMDKFTFWAGVSAGSGIAAAYTLAEASFPVLTWTWISGVSDGARGVPPLGMTVAFSGLLLLVWVCIPMLIFTGVGPVSLQLALFWAQRRAKGSVAAPAVVRAALTAVLLMVVCVPVVIAVLYGAATVVMAYAVARHGGIPRYVPEFHPENLGTGPIARSPLEEPGKGNARVRELWAEAPAVDQCRSARVAGFHVMATITLSFWLIATVTPVL